MRHVLYATLTARLRALENVAREALDQAGCLGGGPAPKTVENINDFTVIWRREGLPLGFEFAGTFPDQTTQNP